MCMAEYMDCEEVREFRQRMIAYIRQEFGNMLGQDVELLDKPGGLQTLLQKYRGKRQV